MLCNGDGLDFLILILRGDRVLVEGEPDTGVAEFLALVSWSDRSADIHTPEGLVRTEQDLVLETDRYRRYVTEAFQDDGVQTLLVFGEEEIQMRSDVDYDWSRRRVDVEFHVNLGKFVLLPPKEFNDRPQR